MIVGLGHKARTGKDTVAAYLNQEHAFVRVAFADALKTACQTIFGLTQEQVNGADKEAIDPFWNATPRDILQRVGTECLRRGYRDDVWVKALERRVKSFVSQGVSIVVTDVRFPNEANAVKQWGGTLVRVDRKTAPTIGGASHASEVSLANYTGWDGVLKNDGTLEELRDKVRQLVARVQGQNVSGFFAL
jgi:hypothetical protein